MRYYQYSIENNLMVGICHIDLKDEGKLPIFSFSAFASFDWCSFNPTDVLRRKPPITQITNQFPQTFSMLQLFVRFLRGRVCR